MATTKSTKSTTSSATVSTSTTTAPATAAAATSPTATPQLPPTPNAALAASVTQAMQAIDGAEAALGIDAPVLTSAEKRRAAKLRSGGAEAVTQIATLAKEYGVESSVLQADTMMLALSDAQTLAPLIVRLQAFVKHVGDVVFVWESAAWSDAMQFYALLQRRALVDGSLAASLAPVAAFFAKRHSSTKAKAGGTPKRTRKANARAVRRLEKAAPELLASHATPAAQQPQPSPAPAAAPPGTSTGNGGAAHS